MIDYRLGFKQRVRRPPSVWVGHRGAVTSNAKASDMHNTAHLRWDSFGLHSQSIIVKSIWRRKKSTRSILERGKGRGGREMQIDEQSSRQMVSRGGPFVWHKPQAWSLPLGPPIAKDRYLPPKAYTVLKV